MTCTIRLQRGVRDVRRPGDDRGTCAPLHPRRLLPSRHVGSHASNRLARAHARLDPGWSDRARVAHVERIQSRNRCGRCGGAVNMHVDYRRSRCARLRVHWKREQCRQGQPAVATIHIILPNENVDSDLSRVACEQLLQALCLAGRICSISKILHQRGHRRKRRSGIGLHPSACHCPRRVMLRISQHNTTRPRESSNAPSACTPTPSPTVSPEWSRR